MRKIKEVLRLNELKLDQRQIARSCSISVSTVHEYLKRATAANLGWPLAEGWDDARLEAALFPDPESPSPTQKSPPDFAAVHEQLQRHRHVTLQLLWDEYREANQEGYGYSRFCELYQRWHKKLDVVLRQQHKAGEKAFVDWAGATLPIYDRDTGKCVAGGAIRRGSRRQLLHLGRGHARPADGVVAAGPYARPGVLGWRACTGGSR